MKSFAGSSGVEASGLEVLCGGGLACESRRRRRRRGPRLPARLTNRTRAVLRRPDFGEREGAGEAAWRYLKAAARRIGRPAGVRGADRCGRILAPASSGPAPFLVESGGEGGAWAGRPTRGDGGVAAHFTQREED